MYNVHEDKKRFFSSVFGAEGGKITPIPTITKLKEKTGKLKEKTGKVKNI